MIFKEKSDSWRNNEWQKVLKRTVIILLDGCLTCSYCIVLREEEDIFLPTRENNCFFSTCRFQINLRVLNSCDYPPNVPTLGSIILLYSLLSFDSKIKTIVVVNRILLIDIKFFLTGFFI